MGWRFCTLKSFPNFQRDDFDCGDEEINNYLRNLVETADEAGFSRTFLMIYESGEAKVYGFYTLSASIIPVKELPDEYRQPLPFPIPALLIGQFAIDKVLGVADLRYERLNMQIIKTIIHKASGFLPGSFSYPD